MRLVKTGQFSNGTSAWRDEREREARGVSRDGQRGARDPDCLIVEVLDAAWGDCSRLSRGHYEIQCRLFCTEEDRESDNVGR